MATHELREPQQLGFAGIHRLKISTTAGKVDVVGADVPDPDADGAGSRDSPGSPGSADRGGRATVDVTRIIGDEPVTVEEADGELTIRHGDLKPGLLGWLTGSRKIESDISVQVPPDCVVEVTIVSGPLVVSNLHEKTKVQGVSGEITLAQLHGPTEVKTVSGSITAESVTDDLSAHTVSGSITVIALGPNSTIKAGTTSGVITIDLEDGTDSPKVDLNCVSGTVIVRAPQDANLEVDMSTMSGRTVTTFDGLGNQPLLGTGFPFNGKGPFGKPQKLYGVLGSGAGHLKARAVSGDVTLLRRVGNPELGEPGQDENSKAGEDK
jgi:hypothetical protein